MAPNLVQISRFVWEWAWAKYNSPLNTPGGFRGSQIQKFREAVKQLIDTRFGTRLQIYFGSGHRLNTIRPTIPQRHFRVFLGGHKFKCFGKLSNGWTDWHQIWYKSADSSGNGHGLNTIHPSIPQEVLGGHKFKKILGSCQTTALIDTKFSTRLRIRLGVDIG